jgi:hypothetical protein
MAFQLLEINILMLVAHQLHVELEQQVEQVEEEVPQVIAQEELLQLVCAQLVLGRKHEINILMLVAHQLHVELDQQVPVHSMDQQPEIALVVFLLLVVHVMLQLLEINILMLVAHQPLVALEQQVMLLEMGQLHHLLFVLIVLNF